MAPTHSTTDADHSDMPKGSLKSASFKVKGCRNSIYVRYSTIRSSRRPLKVLELTPKDKGALLYACMLNLGLYIRHGPFWGVSFFNLNLAVNGI